MKREPILVGLAALLVLLVLWRHHGATNTIVSQSSQDIPANIVVSPAVTTVTIDPIVIPTLDMNSGPAAWAQSTNLGCMCDDGSKPVMLSVDGQAPIAVTPASLAVAQYTYVKEGL